MELMIRPTLALLVALAAGSIKICCFQKENTQRAKTHACAYKPQKAAESVKQSRADLLFNPPLPESFFLSSLSFCA